jgi:FO synthase
VFALRRVARAYGCLQEVIVQNFRAKPDTAVRHADDLDLDEYRAAIAITRLVLGPKARVQAPPNLVDLAECRALLDAGVDDWGGVSPLTPDHVNPERPWPSLDGLRSLTTDAGFELRARLSVHPEYVTGSLVRGEAWLDPRVVPHVAALAGEDGLARPGVRPSGLPWQEPDPALADRGRTDLHTGIDTTGRTHDRRTDFDTVYGDWDSLREQVTGRQARHDALRGLVAEGRAALAAAERDPAGLTDEQALTLMTADGELLDQVCRLADQLRRDTVGDEVTYVVNRNINFTNVCYVGCRFCAFAQRCSDADADAYSLSLEQVADRAQEAWELGATEVCMQGGIDPELPGTAYFELVRAVKQRVPGMHVHAFSPMEIVNGATRTGLSIEGFLIEPSRRHSRRGGPRGRTRHHPRHSRGDPRRRGPLDPDQGQAPDRHLDRGRWHRAQGGPAVELDDDVRPRRPPPDTGSATCA